jgi:hypothetical protein
VKGEEKLMDRKWMIDMTPAGAKLLAKVLDLAAEPSPRDREKIVRLVVTSEGLEVMAQIEFKPGWLSIAKLLFNDSMELNLTKPGEDPKNYGSVV